VKYFFELFYQLLPPTYTFHIKVEKGDLTDSGIQMLMKCRCKPPDRMSTLAHSSFCSRPMPIIFFIPSSWNT